MRSHFFLALMAIVATTFVSAINCAPGYAGTIACAPCALGTYSPGGDVASCQRCPANTYAALASASACTACPVDTDTGGLLGSLGIAACVACKTGTSTLGAGVACAACPDGSQFYKDGLSLSVLGPLGTQLVITAGLPPGCRSCPAGAFSAGGANCAVCTAGSFATGSNNKACTLAPQGSFVAAAGATTATQCAYGTYSASSGQIGCTACATGSGTIAQGSTAASACVAQTAGTVIQNGRLITCPAGTISTTGGTTCTPCSGNTIAAAAGSTTCSACAANEVTLDHISCTQLPSGSILSNGVITICPAGTSPDSTKTSCATCPGNTIAALAGTAVCTACGQNSVTLDHITCSNVAAGSIFADGKITLCPAGTTSDSTRTSCVTCLGNTIAAIAGSPLCTPCSGTQATVDHVTCQAVAAGSIYSNGAITLCPKGTTSDATRTTCVACSGNTIAPILGSPSCEQCTGTTVTVDNILCQNVPAGSIYQNGRISLCAAGTAPNAAQTFCSPCSGNTIAPIAGSGSCTGCTGLTATLDHITCDLIPEGSIYVDGRITACAAGTTSDVTRRLCNPCSGNTIAAVEGTVCSACPALQYASADHISCSAIPVGYILQSDVLVACEAGTTSDSQHLTCVDCLGVSVAATLGSQCVDCPSGQTTDDHITCRDVRPGYYIEDRQEKPCPAGTSTAPGGTSCTACGGNNIAPTPGSTCSPCPGTQQTTDHITCQAVASGNLEEASKRALKRANAFLCPAGKRACWPYATKKDPRRKFQCIDTANNAVACGGCPVGYEDVNGKSVGEDCTDFDNIAKAVCVQGKCEYTCPAGWKLVVGRGCVKLARLTLQ